MQTIEPHKLEIVTGGKAAPTTSHVGSKSGTLGTGSSNDSLLSALSGLQSSLSGLSNNNGWGGGNDMMMLLMMMAFMGGHNNTYIYGGGGGGYGYPAYGGWGGCGGWHSSSTYREWGW